MTWRAFIGGALFLVPEQVAVKHCTRPSRAVHPISVGAGRVWLARLPLPSIRSLWFKVCAVFQYSEHKLVLLKTCKPICYIFAEGGAPDMIKSKEQAEEEEEESDKTVYQRRRSPSPAERY